MPIYEYRCQSCGHELDALQKIADPPLTDCPECNEAALKRLVSAPSFRLKGSGWYETDFKSDKERKRNLAGGEGAGKGDGKGDGAKESSGDAGGKSEKSADKSADAGTKPAAAKTESKAGGKSAGSEAA